MHKKPKSTAFKFILTNQQLLSNLDHLKLNDYERFIKIGNIGKQIQELAKADDYKALQQLCDKNYMDLQFMKMEIQDAFASALHLRNQGVVQYFLDNGIDLDSIEPACIVQVCYSLEYLRHDPPISLLKILLQHGGNPRYPASQNSDTALHIAARYANLQFIELLLQYGGDINAANDQRKTPLNCAIQEGKKKDVIQFLKSKGASQKWNA